MYRRHGTRCPARDKWSHNPHAGLNLRNTGTWISPAQASGERTSNPRFRRGSRPTARARPSAVDVTSYHHAMSTPESRFAALGFELPPAPPPGGVYRPVVVAGSLAFVSGHGPVRPDRTLITGRVGADSTTAPSASGKPSVSTSDRNGPIWRGGKLTTAITCLPINSSGE